MTNDGVQTIDRSIDLLEALAESPCSLTEICRTTGLSKGTAFRLLAALGNRGIVMKDAVGATYMLGPALARLVQGALTGVAAIDTLGKNSLGELSYATRETVALHAQSGIERICIGEIPSEQPIRYISTVGSVAPLHIGSAGKVLLASMDPRRLERSLNLLKINDPDLSVGSLRRSLRQVAKGGWAISHSERVEGASAISIPVRTPFLLLSLSVLGPTQRLTDSILRDMLPEMQTAADELQNSLDFGPELEFSS